MVVSSQEGEEHNNPIKPFFSYLFFKLVLCGRFIKCMFSHLISHCALWSVSVALWGEDRLAWAGPALPSPGLSQHEDSGAWGCLEASLIVPVKLIITKDFLYIFFTFTCFYIFMMITVLCWAYWALNVCDQSEKSVFQVEANYVVCTYKMNNISTTLHNWGSEPVSDVCGLVLSLQSVKYMILWTYQFQTLGP